MRVSVFVSVWVTFAAVLLSGRTSAEAQTVAPDGAIFHKIIKDQMKAFAAGDANTAFSYATTALQQRFQTPAIYLDAVKRGYRPVYSPRDITFGTSKVTSKGPVQEVYLTGPEGEDWLALYSFEQQEDGSWRISGCYLTKSTGYPA
jgi:hypothetical protein